MKIPVALVLFLALAGWSRAATTFPASTNANQTFFGANSFSFPITLLSSTASTIQKVDGSKATASIANSGGALTNDGAGLFGWFASFATFSDLVTTSNALVTLINNSTNNHDLNVTNISTGSLTVTNGITNLSLTANTVLKADAFKVVTSIANGTGALTNNNAGLFGWFTYASGSDILTYSNNATTFVGTTVNTLSNNILAQVATSNVFNTITVEQVDYLTNSTMAPDFSKGYSATNVSAGFTFLSPLHVDSTKTKVQTAVVRVDNTSGSAIVIAPPANVFVISNSFMGVGANGTTWFTFVSYPPDRTNVYASAEAH